MYNSTITLFNRLAGKNGDRWYATVIPGIHLVLDQSALLKIYGADSKNSAMLYIPFSNNDGVIRVAGTEWLPPKAWKAEEEAKEALTFKGGVDFDFFMEGRWTGDRVIEGEKYPDGFYNHMKENFDNVFAITSVSGPFSLIPHFEVVGK